MPLYGKLPVLKSTFGPVLNPLTTKSKEEKKGKVTYL
jgi:hypothetical protein